MLGTGGPWEALGERLRKQVSKGPASRSREDWTGKLIPKAL